MQFIGNILTKNLFDNTELYNVVLSKEDLIKGIPTLCIGRAFTQENYTDFDILKFEIEKDVFWTYGPREKRNIYEKRLNEFEKKAIESFIKSVHYKFINVLINEKDSEDCQRLKNILNAETKTTSFVYNNMAYVYDEQNKCVYGISLRDLSYKGRDVKKFLSVLYRKTRVISLKDDVSFEIKSAFFGNNYVIPCLYY